MVKNKVIKDSNNRDFFECKLIPDEHIIHGIWTGNMLEIDPAKEAAMTFVDFLQKSTADMVLDDNRLGIGPWPDFNNWLMEVWLPAISNTSLRRYAHVMSPDGSAKGPAFEMFNQVKNNAVFATFDSYDSALSWLKDE